jgi:hypothetical protein
MKSKQVKKAKKKVYKQVSLDPEPQVINRVIIPKKTKKKYMVYLPEHDTNYLKSMAAGSSLSGILSLLIQALAKDIRRRSMPTNETYILNLVVHKFVDFLRSS